MAGQLGFLWEDEIEAIHAVLIRYNLDVPIMGSTSHSYLMERECALPHAPVQTG